MLLHVLALTHPRLSSEVEQNRSISVKVEPPIFAHGLLKMVTRNLTPGKLAPGNLNPENSLPKIRNQKFTPKISLPKPFSKRGRICLTG
jgi:hypothetical protein